MSRSRHPHSDAASSAKNGETFKVPEPAVTSWLASSISPPLHSDISMGRIRQFSCPPYMSICLLTNYMETTGNVTASTYNDSLTRVALLTLLYKSISRTEDKRWRS
ncbi:hypothetical protein PAAG_11559 [Paracoccidioides lutzii Pb01]|uniref:Uncharacterized protein n=1 Tax=Paracoccidioides lutzii (strain ATCC MYA-826 / Pb01) TaxID=502779 RepID=A0A0A2V5W7_PARBA|nr:hypothetical protein PAAG_11559 [Paracoccidioides lutzii Pb01]KGQ01712.1 hypothetical protein PAAG_11559 [Paracoccidioides lutzii Pb01]